MGKWLEKLACCRLVSFMEEGNHWGDHQCGFRRNRGTHLALRRVVNYIFDAMNERDQVLGVSLDLSSAFDLVNHDLLINRLRCLSIPSYLLKLIDTFLSNRTADITVN